MLNSFIDIFATLTETFMLYILYKNNKMRSLKYLIFSFIVYFLSIRLVTMQGATQTSKLFVFLTVNTVIGYLIFQNHLIKSVILSFLHIISIYLGELSIQSVLLLLYQPGLINLFAKPFLFVCVVFLSKIISILCCIIFQRIFGDLEYPYNWKLSFCLLFPLSLILWTMAQLQELVSSTNVAPKVFEEALLALGLLIAMICLLYIYQYYFRIKELQLSKNISESQMLSTFRFYEDRIFHEANNRRIYHDIQAHIATLEAMQASSEKTEFSQNLLEQLRNMNFPHNTGIETIDIVLNEKQIACNKAGIKIICIGDFRPLEILKPMELVTIFHNAIDNALNEYENHNYPDKIIEIQSWICHNFIHLRFKNHFTEDRKPEKLETSDLHGWGIRNMKHVIGRYNGEVIPSIEDGCFYLRIIIPLIPESLNNR